MSKQIVENLKEQLEQYEYYLADEEQRISNNTKDEYLIGLLKVRVASYKRHIEELKGTIKTFEQKDST